MFCAESHRAPCASSPADPGSNMIINRVHVPYFLVGMSVARDLASLTLAEC